MSFKLISSIFVISLAIVLLSCSNTTKRDESTLKAIDESLIKSNDVLDHANTIIYMTLKERSQERPSYEKVILWNANATKVDSLCNNMGRQIDLLRLEISKKQKLTAEKLDEINNKMRVFKKNLLGIDSVLTIRFDSTLNSPVYSSELSFENMSIEEALVLMDKTKNDVKTIEYRMIYYCDQKCIIDVDYFTSYSVIIAQNSFIVQPGKTVEITAGVGAFSTKAQPEIIIAGKKYAIDINGVALYKFSAPGRLGKHYVPVTINFIDQDGNRQTISKIVEYTIK